ncbi:IclR family transcriptional regulator [Prosthecobacter dejongeii]|uniref:IclR family acetate operon transcriptional repressor n=1 Tax=Prosthecobacter dejongeii TaxID=48465 RepID=A0A7W7YKN2_9BACT|nr:IclR family transcriptional regulator [Prosthecobacter dejongeii]MBB5037981.1 IclR family acetate operon transcriptional repressor [Prosthecobacter dejongeii]
MPADRRAPPNPLNRYRVPILDRTLDLLELLSQHPEGLTLTAVTERLAMPKNSVFRILTTLTLRGYAERDEPTKAYRLSRKLLSVSHGAIGGRRLLQAASGILTALRDATGETALLGTLSGSQGVVLDQVVSSYPVKVVVEVGHAFPLHTAAPAKAMLAFMPEDKRNALIKGIHFTKHTKTTLTSTKAFVAELSEVNNNGYALDRCEESEAYACAAAPVFDAREEVIAAIWISGPSDRLPLSKLPAVGKIVAAHAVKLSTSMGSLDAHCG